MPFSNLHYLLRFPLGYPKDISNSKWLKLNLLSSSKKTLVVWGSYCINNSSHLSQDLFLTLFSPSSTYPVSKTRWFHLLPLNCIFFSSLLPTTFFKLLPVLTRITFNRSLVGVPPSYPAHHGNYPLHCLQSIFLNIRGREASRETPEEEY